MEMPHHIFWCFVAGVQFEDFSHQQQRVAPRKSKQRNGEKVLYI